MDPTTNQLKENIINSSLNYENKHLFQAERFGRPLRVRIISLSAHLHAVMFDVHSCSEIRDNLSCPRTLSLSYLANVHARTLVFNLKTSD